MIYIILGGLDKKYNGGMPGGVTERPKVGDLKSPVGLRAHRGFESLPLRNINNLTKII
jgi:hypothetical protein